MSNTADDVSAASESDAEIWQRTAAEPRYQELKRRYRRFVIPIVAVTLVWYFTYVLLGTFAHTFMSTPVIGNVNIALILGLSQFAVSFVFATLYIRFANRRLDPLSDALRDQADPPAEAATPTPGVAR